MKTPATQWFPAVSAPREPAHLGSRVPTIDLAGQWSEVQSPGSPPLPAAGYGYSILVPPNATNFAVTDQWIRPPAGKNPQSGLAPVAIAYPHMPARPRRKPRRPGDVSRDRAGDAPAGGRFWVGPAAPGRGRDRSLARRRAEGRRLWPALLLDEIFRKHPHDRPILRPSSAVCCPVPRAWLAARSAVNPENIAAGPPVGSEEATGRGLLSRLVPAGFGGEVKCLRVRCSCWPC